MLQGALNIEKMLQTPPITVERSGALDQYEVAVGSASSTATNIFRDFLNGSTAQVSDKELSLSPRINRTKKCETFSTDSY